MSDVNAPEAGAIPGSNNVVDPVTYTEEQVTALCSKLRTLLVAAGKDVTGFEDLFNASKKLI